MPIQTIQAAIPAVTANSKFWEFKNVAGAGEKTAELILYGDISQTSWWGDEVTPRQFSDDLKALGDVDTIIVRINSRGGDVFAAFGIGTRLKDHPAKTIAKIDGWAASAATIIASFCDKILIPAAAVYMIHDPQIGILGYFTKEELIQLAEELVVIKQAIVNAYAAKTGKTDEEIAQLMSAETWLDGAQAVEKGFCDELMFRDSAAAGANNYACMFVNSVYSAKNMPDFLKMFTSQQEQALPENGAVINKKNESEDNTMEKPEAITNLDQLRAAYPSLVNEAEGKAALKERERIQAIENMVPAGFEEIANKAKFTEPQTAEQVAVNIITAQKAQGQEFLKNRGTDVNNSGMGEVPAAGQDVTDSQSSEKELNDVLDAVFGETK